jgi:hypothetical protein
MSKKRKDWRLYLLDMLECIKRIEKKRQETFQKKSKQGTATFPGLR